MPKNPLVSVIIPVYNGQQLLQQAWQMLLDQAYSPLEVIVVDDGSTDETGVIAKTIPQIIYLHQENKGPSAARNLGLEQASAEFITFLDIDDQYPAHKLQWQAAYLSEHPQIEVVVGGIKTIWSAGMQPRLSPFELENDMRAFVNLGASMFRRAAFERVGNFAEELLYSEDVDWFLRALEKEARIKIVKKPGLLYLKHPSSYSELAGEKQMRTSFFYALQRSVKRRREPDGSVRTLPNWTDYFEDALPGEMQLPFWKDSGP